MNQSENRAKTILSRALELASREERDAMIEQECGDDLALRDQVLGLLNALDQPHADRFLEDPPSMVSALGGVSVMSEKVGDTLGHYELVDVIGEGGF